MGGPSRKSVLGWGKQESKEENANYICTRASGENKKIIWEEGIWNPETRHCVMQINAGGWGIRSCQLQEKKKKTYKKNTRR